jgi:hypothetical protein
MPRQGDARSGCIGKHCASRVVRPAVDASPVTSTRWKHWALRKQAYRGHLIRGSRGTVLRQAVLGCMHAPVGAEDCHITGALEPK